MRGYPTVDCQRITDFSKLALPKLNRVLVTGQIENLPEWLTEGLEEGGFAIAPIGNKNSQRLLKIEKQGEELFETDLGSVVFGPLDIADSVIEIPSPAEMAELIEQVIELMQEAKIIQEEDKSKLYDLVAELRQLPDDLPPPEDTENPEEHPLLKLMAKEGEWFIRLWPIIQSIFETRIASYDSPSDFEDGSSHSDFIP